MCLHVSGNPHKALHLVSKVQLFRNFFFRISFLNFWNRKIINMTLYLLYVKVIQLVQIFFLFALNKSIFKNINLDFDLYRWGCRGRLLAGHSHGGVQLALDRRYSRHNSSKQFVGSSDRGSHVPREYTKRRGLVSQTGTWQ